MSLPRAIIATMRSDRGEQADERAEGLAMLGTIVFCCIVGAGVGVFAEQPVVGALAGGVIGIALGFWLAPRLVRDWR